ncbi:type IV toxin-antitoxin system AbiEi family antitoxin [Cellulomonas sp. Y8]|uniref:type IV toxin-antitoxin system AbiEi family antitoxin n=1 Tax=Cellulomonas sp. Y8 TaxID=2591145 RepID=UPI003D732DA8
MPDARRVIARRPLRTVRPAHLEGVFANPRAALRRLEHEGVVHRLAYGYYCEVPAEADPDTWLPSLEAAAMGVAVARGGPPDPVLMGMSAARVLGALPRAVATATVAVAVGGRRPVRLVDRPATVRFVERDTSALDAERMSLDLGSALVTTPEQTLLDLVRLYPDDPETPAVVRALWSGADREQLEHLARTSRGIATLRRAEVLVS